jgi:putative ABC transport system permease protein
MDEKRPAERIPTIRRAYRALLKLLPFEFRAEFGRDMEQAFSEENDDVRARRSVKETLGFWLRTLHDFVRTAPRQHWDVLRQDVRVGTRLLRRNPGFSATAILTLALGIGGSTSIFSIVHAVVLRPLAFPESERVVRIGWAGEGDDITRGLSGVSVRHLQTLREQTSAFEVIGGITRDELSSGTVSLDVPVDEAPGFPGVGQGFSAPAMTSAVLFEVFGARTVLGRLPTERDEQPGATPVALLSYGTWTSRYGRDPGVVGHTLTRNVGAGREQTVTIVGVLAPDAFNASRSTNRTPARTPLDADLVATRYDGASSSVAIYGRLAAGASIDAARAEIAALTPQLALDLPKYLASRNASLRVVSLRDQLVGAVRTPLMALLGAVSCLLLVASVNVGSLVLARSISRRQEFAARFALGARPLRVARQLLTESAILALCGGALGLALAWALGQAFVAVSPAMPRLDESGIGTPAALFALAAVLFATCLTGLVPAIQSSRRSVLDGLRRAGGPPTVATAFSKPLSALAAIEVALVLVLLAGTGLLVNTFTRLYLFDLGFDARSTIMTTIESNVPPAGPARRPAPEGLQTVAAVTDRGRSLLAVHDDVMRHVSTIPGIAAAGLTGDVPFGPPYRYGADLTIGDLATEAALRIASPNAFDALGMRMAAGRWFSAEDRGGASYVAVVNETMAKRFWPERSPIGDRIVFGHRAMQVIGVVADVYDRGARGEVTATLYATSRQLLPDPFALIVRAHPGAHGVEQAIAAELGRMGTRIKAGSPRRLEDFWWRQLTDARFLTTVLSVFSLLALVVALVGVHGVLRFLVAQRTREIGIRKALGATGFDVVALVVGQALRFALPGCIVGLIAAAAAGPALRSLLFGITPTDPLTLVSATVLLVAAVLVGAYFPARRASAVDPALSLRAE